MAGPWKQYKAPNGRKYYYNVETKETTWTNPYQKVTKKPCFAIPLINDWYLIIYDNGEKLYLHDNQLYKTLEDKECQELLQLLDKDKLILLIGIARGYNSLKSSDTVYDSILKEIKSIKQGGVGDIGVDPVMDDIGVDSVIDDIGTDNIGVDEPAHENQDETISEQENESNVTEPTVTQVSTTNSLFAGYLSSEDDDDDEESDPEQDDDEHIAKKVKVDEESFSNDIDDDTINQYKKMFTQCKLNPYGLWSMEMKKCSDNPIFYSVTDDHDRETIFETWCGEYESNKENDTEDEEEEEEEEDLIPTKFHYLSHIMSKSNITKETIFEDIKSDNKARWKQFRINKMIPNKKEQREFVTKLLFYYKKYDNEERVELFKEWVKKHCNLQKHMDPHWEELHSHGESSQDIETLLFLMERQFNINEVLITHPTRCYEYYIMGIKTKCDTLFAMVHC